MLETCVHVVDFQLFPSGRARTFHFPSVVVGFWCFLVASNLDRAISSSIMGHPWKLHVIYIGFSKLVCYHFLLKPLTFGSPEFRFLIYWPKFCWVKPPRTLGHSTTPFSSRGRCSSDFHPFSGTKKICESISKSIVDFPSWCFIKPASPFFQGWAIGLGNFCNIIFAVTWLSSASMAHQSTQRQVPRLASRWRRPPNPVGNFYMGVEPKTGGKHPKWMVKIRENPIKMDDLGVPLFLETPI